MSKLLGAIQQYGFFDILHFLMGAGVLAFGFHFVWKEFRPQHRNGWIFLGLFFVAPPIVASGIGFAGASETASAASVSLTMAVVILLSMWERRHRHRRATDE